MHFWSGFFAITSTREHSNKEEHEHAKISIRAFPFRLRLFSSVGQSPAWTQASHLPVMPHIPSFAALAERTSSGEQAGRSCQKCDCCTRSRNTGVGTVAAHDEAAGVQKKEESEMQQAAPHLFTRSSHCLGSYVAKGHGWCPDSLFTSTTIWVETRRTYCPGTLGIGTPCNTAGCGGPVVQTDNTGLTQQTTRATRTPSQHPASQQLASKMNTARSPRPFLSSSRAGLANAGLSQMSFGNTMSSRLLSASRTSSFTS